MTERKVIMIEKKRDLHGSVIVVEEVPRVFAVGEEAPTGHERRPYTKYIDDGDERMNTAAPNRMQSPGTNRGD